MTRTGPDIDRSPAGR